MAIVTWTIRITVLIFVTNPVSSLKCLQCNSVQNPKCFYGTEEPTECPFKNHTFCVTYSGSLQQRHLYLLLRDCSAVNFSNSCILLPDDHPNNRTSERLRFCHTTCITDGCNHYQIRPASANLAVLSIQIPMIRLLPLSLTVVAFIFALAFQL